MKLFIVRHAQSQGNATGDYSVDSHDSLSELGQRQAASLADSLHLLNFDKIIVSPLQRALETLTPYLEATGQRAEIWPEIAEGCWQRPVDTPRDCWRTQPASVPEVVKHLFTFREDRAIKPVDKTFEEGVLRADDAYRLLQDMATDSGACVLMLTHGHFIRELLNRLLDTRHCVSFAHDNCGVTSLTFDGLWNMNYCNRPAGIGTATKPQLQTLVDGAPDPRRFYGR
jgi:broad specificity phosphatase PhoE